MMCSHLRTTTGQRFESAHQLHQKSPGTVWVPGLFCVHGSFVLRRKESERASPKAFLQPAGFTSPSAASKSRWTRQGCGQRRASIFQLGQGVFLNSIHFVRSQGMEEQLENLRNAVKALKKRIERPSLSAITGSLP